MGCLLRSDPMTQCDVFLQPDAAFPVIACLGETGCVQFDDLNEDMNAFQRTYVTEICRCAEMERKLRYLAEKMAEDEINIPKLKIYPDALVLHEMPQFESTVEAWDRRVTELSNNLTNLTKNYSQLTEMRFVLSGIGEMLGDADVRRSYGLAVMKKVAAKAGKSTMRAAAAVQETGGRLVVITGLVQRRRSYSFQLMLWRLSRGCAYYRQTDNDEIFKDVTANNSDVRKVAFLLVVQGESLGGRMKKVCEGFRCDLYPIPAMPEDRTNTLIELDSRIMELDTVVRQSKYHRCKAMREIAKMYRTYLIKIKKAKAVYHTMNQFTLDITRKCLIGRCWIPTADLTRVQDIFHDFSQGANVESFLSKVETQDQPPTFHRTNRFTHGFQALIDAYGESTYRELNPGLYTIITFPFLFSLMFGDMGHGTIMFLTATWMLVNEKKFLEERSESEIWNIFFGGRYIIFLMGLFSIYAGFVYNDCFSKSFRIFATGWYFEKPLSEFSEHEEFIMEPKNHSGAYIFGKDPFWELAHNKILFENSFKMKLSIIIGVIHMLFALTLSFFNDLYFKKRHLIFLEFLPQILFMMCVFLWLVFLIFFKWFKYGGAHPATDKETQSCAPLVLILFIDMVLMKTSKGVLPECDAYMFDGQQAIQQLLLFIALVSVPVMLFGPPCFVAQMNKKKKEKLMKKVPPPDSPEYTIWSKELHEASETFGELMIHQAVHTIEYVLSTVSHTASYLRLWALSLAHAQLSEMLWAMVFSKMALTDYSIVGGPKIVVVFGIWAFFTVAILVLMEALSAFLHTLRLHWVEFMSKFFGGQGYLFQPFSFEALFADSSKDKIEVCPTTIKTFDY